MSPTPSLATIRWIRAPAFPPLPHLPQTLLIRVKSTLPQAGALPGAFRRASLLLAILLAGPALSCSGAEKKPAPPPLPPAAHAARLPLSDYVPAAGLRWLVHARPREIFADERLLADWKTVFTEKRLRDFQNSSGFRARDVEELFIAGYGLGTLYLFDARLVGRDVEAAFRSRAMSTGNRETGRDDLTHLTGIIADSPQALVHLDQHFAAIVEDDLTLAKFVVAYAQERLKKSPPALETNSLKRHRSFEPKSPLRIFLRGPFDEATDAVSGSFASGVAAFSHRGGHLHLTAEVLGLWPESSSLATDLRKWFIDVLDTREMRALGWGFPTSAPEVICDPGSTQLTESLRGSRCEASAAWNSEQIATATHRITSADTSTLLSEKAPSGWRSETQSGKASAPLPSEPEPPQTKALEDPIPVK